MRVQEERSRRPRWAAAVAGLTALGVLSAGCGGGGDETPTLEEQVGFDTEGILERQVEIEQLTRDCMQSQGFEYVPVDPKAQRAELVGSADLSEEDFEKQYGYGITTLYEQRKNLTSNPNTAIRQKLSEEEQLAYDRALYGEHTEATFEFALDTGEFSRLGGCTRQATETSFGGADRLETLVTKIEEVDARIESDPRMTAALAAWSGCMRDKGYDGMTDPEQVNAVLNKKLEAIVGASGTPGAGENYDRAALAELQREEVALVTVDIECENEHVRKVEEDVRTEFEAAFREENPDLLSNLKTS